MFNKNETEKLFIVLNRIMNSSLYLIVLATQEQNKIHKLN